MLIVILIMVVALLSPKLIKIPKSIMNILYVNEEEDKIENVEISKNIDDEIDKYVVDSDFDPTSDAEDLLSLINGEKK